MTEVTDGGGPANQDYNQLIVDQINDAYLDFSGSISVDWNFSGGALPIKITQIQLRVGADCENRDPVNWSLYGKTATGGFETLFAFSHTTIYRYGGRSTLYTYDLSKIGTYTGLRLNANRFGAPSIGGTGFCTDSNIQIAYYGITGCFFV